MRKTPTALLKVKSLKLSTGDCGSLTLNIQRSTLPAGSLHGCVNPVGGASTSMWVSTPGLPQAAGHLLVGVGKARGLYTFCIQVLLDAIHHFLTKFSSVTAKVLHTIHTPYNNKEILKIYYLLIKRSEP